MRPEHFRSGLRLDLGYSVIAAGQGFNEAGAFPLRITGRALPPQLRAALRFNEAGAFPLRITRLLGRVSAALHVASMRPEHFRSGLPRDQRGDRERFSAGFNEAGAFPLRITRRTSAARLAGVGASMRPEHFRSGLPGERRHDRCRILASMRPEHFRSGLPGNFANSAQSQALLQ